MRTAPSLTLLIALAGVASLAPAADDPPPLLKAVTPPAGSVRARVPVKEDKNTLMQFNALIPKPQGKKGETIEVKVLIDNHPSTASVARKTWEKWGFEVPNNRTGVLSELLIPGAQLAPKPTKGWDVEARFANLKLEIVEPPKGADPFFGCDMVLSLNDLTKGADRAYEPRIHFADRFIDLTVPGAALRRPNTGDDAPAEPGVTGDPGLVAAAGPFVQRGWQVFAFASLNGLTAYKSPDGKAETVNVAVSTIMNYPAPGIVVSVNTARGCGVEFQPPKAGDWDTAEGTAKELRLALFTGPGLKAPKDFVLRDVKVVVRNDKTAAYVYLGPRFVEEYFKDGVYACGPDGVWRLHGRVKPDLLEDIKTRTPPKKQ